MTVLKGAPDGIFPSLNDPTTEEEVCLVHKLPNEALETIIPFTCAQSKGYGAFLRTVWSIVIRQYIGSDNVCFGQWAIEKSAPDAGCARQPRDIRTKGDVVEVDIVPDEAVGSFWRRNQLPKYMDAETSGINYNTGVMIGEEIGQGDAVLILEEVERHQRATSSECNLLLVLEQTFGTPETLYIISKASVLSREQLQHLASTTSHTILEIANDPIQCVKNLGLISPQEKNLLIAWNNLLCEDARKPTIVESIRTHAMSRPYAVALCSWDGQLTFGELEMHTSSLAFFLTRIGVGPTSLVPIMFEKSQWAIVCQLAVLKTGAAFMPLEPSDPDERLRRMIRKSAAKAILSSEMYAFRSAPWCSINISVSRSFLLSLPPADPNSQLPPTDYAAPAYVLFTSGSTGEPKGVVIEHQAMAQLAWHAAYQRIDGSSRTLQFAAYTFTMAIAETYMSLAVGATLCIPSDHDRINRFPEVMEEMEISWALFTPSLLRRLDADCPPANLKTVSIGGEPLGNREFQCWFNKVDLLNGYGMSENAGFTSLAPLTSQQSDLTAFPPSPTTRRWLVDPTDHDRLVPIGVVGELLLEGPGLASGYFGDPDATTQAFIASPQWRKSMRGLIATCDRLYKTGDLFRLSPTGSIKYIGRKGTQVKIRGKRVDLGEVEAHLRQSCPEGTSVVAETATPADQKDTTALVAFLCSADEANKAFTSSAWLVGNSSVQFRSQVDLIRGKLQASLPEHMQPALYIPVNYIPMTVTGKLARRVLREVIQERTRADLESYQSSAVAVTLPSSADEKYLHVLFAQVLKLDASNFGIDHDFIRLGGDSLAAMRLVNLLRPRMGSLTVAHILEHRTIANLVSLLPDLPEDSDATTQSDHKVNLPGKVEIWNKKIVPASLKEALIATGIRDIADVEEIIPCSSIQEGLLLSHVRNAQLYHTRVVWEISSEVEGESLNVAQVQAAWQMVCARHPMLRTIFLESPIAGHLMLQAVLKPTCPGVATASYSTNSHEAPPTRTQALRHSLSGMSWLPKLQLSQASRVRLYCTLDIHHALMDAVSMNIIESDLRSLYHTVSADSQGFDCLLSTKSSYADYIRLLSTLNAHSHLDFWKSELQGIEPCMFPQLGGREEDGPSPRLCSIDVDLRLGDAGSIDSFCKKTGVTVANMFKLAWALVLNSYTSSPNVCFGYMTAGRDLPLDDVERVVGPFIQTLPCYWQLDQHKTSIDAVEGLQAGFIRALPHQNISLAELHHALGLTGQGLFNTVMTFLPRQYSGLQPSSIALRRIGFEGPTEYDLVLEVEPVLSGFECKIKYWSSFISAQGASRVAGLMRAAMRHIMHKPHVSLKGMELVSEQDKQQLKLWSGTTPSASNTLLHDLIQQTCQAQPDDLAVHAWDGTLTYQQLDKLSSVLAAELQKRAIGPDIFVPICLDRCRWTPVAVLGVIKAGGAFCLLDPSHPTSRLSEICQAVAAPMILVGEGTLERGAALQVRFLVVGNNLWEAEQPIDLTTNVTPSHALYAVFTSGSTGKPKGVVLEHRCFCPTALMCPEPLQLRSQDRTLHFASYAFDVSVIEVIVPLVVGACICIPSEEERLNCLPRFITQFNVSWAFITPTVARLLQPEELPSLRTLVLGGEAVLASDIDTWSTWTRLISAYSPAECTPVGLSTTVSWESPNRLGWAFPSLATWVVDPSNYQRLAPIGAIGELIIEGPVVGRGYLHDPMGSLPGSPFITAPDWLREFRPNLPYPRLYRTGDLVQYDNNGAIRFVGRKDTQVKVRGQRLEPGEIEYHVRIHLPWARTVIVEPVILSSQGTDAVVVAFISEQEPDPGQDATVAPRLGLNDRKFFAQMADAAAKLRAHLPSWMVPTIFLPLAQIPLTKSGKIDRKQLKELVVSMPREDLEGIETGPRDKPATNMELKLQSLFAKVLHIPLEKVWANSDFFMLGGDSVGAMRLVSAGLEKGIDISVGKIFKHSTLRDLAANVSLKDIGFQLGGPIPCFSLLPENEKERILQLVARECDLQEQEIDDIYPCIPLQEALIAATAKESSMYTAHFVYDLLDGANMGKLQQAWEATAHNNAILRTRIVDILPYGALQVVVKKCHTRIDWPHYNSAKAYEEGTANVPMGLGCQLLRFGIIDAPGDRQAIGITLHHAIYDAISLGILLQQIDAVYQGLTPEVRQFNLIVKYLEEQNLSVSDDFWRAQFAGLEAPVFPVLPSNVTNPKATEHLQQETSISLVSRQSGITTANFIRLAWALLASYYTDSQDVVFGATVTGRALPIHAIEDISGPTIATLPFPVHIESSQSVQEALSVVQAQATRMVPFEHTGLQNIRRVSQEAAAACEFQSQLVVESPESTDSISHTMAPRGRSSVSAAFSSYAIVLVCTPSQAGDKVKIEAQYDPEVMDTKALSRILSQFAHVLGQLCSRPHQRIRDVQVNSPSDVKLLRQWNQTLPAPYLHTLHELILGRAAECTSDMAIDSWDGQMTYGQLDAESALVGKQLMQAGVQLGDRVALCFQRSKWSVVAILSVLRAGATCVNIDPALPSGRVRQIMDMSQPSLFLTSADNPVPVKPLAHVPSLFLPSRLEAPDQHSWPVTTPEDVAFIIFTSGSTGAPKGIVIEHVNIASSVYSHSKTVGAHPTMRTLHFASYAFDAILSEIFTTWSQGGCVCIPSETDRLSNLAGSIEKYCVNWALMTPSALSILRPEDVPCLKTLAVGGEPIPTDLVNTWGSNLQLINAYGPTETSIYCAGGPLIPGVSSPGLLGHMMGTVGWITVPGDYERLAPLGAVGELLIEGPLVTRGYLHDPEKTKSAFIETPKWLRTWRSGNSSRVFRSGDLVQYEHDGQLRFVGRKDTQVKIRGQRLELPEVENHLRSAIPTAHTVVTDVIRRRQNSSKPDFLIGFLHFGRENSSDKRGHIFQDKDERSVREAFLGRQRLEEALPAYMVPDVLVSLAYVPYTSTGKVDRRALRQGAEDLTPVQLQSFGLVSCSEAKELVQNEDESTWQKLWSQVLLVEREAIYRESHFFRMGGDSVAAMKLSSLARCEGFEITVAEIFNHSLLKDMAAAARSSTYRGRQSSLPPFSLVPRDTLLDRLVESASRICEAPVDQILDIYPCTPIQAGLMALTSQQAGAYMALYKFILPRDIEVDQLRAAWNLTADAHPILRTRIVQIATGETYQAVIDGPLSWRPLEQGVSKFDQLHHTARMGAPLLHLMYDPSPCLSKLPELYVSIHHALYDGWSWSLLLQEIDRAYKGLLLHASPFNSFVGQVHKNMQAAAIFWEAKLKNADPAFYPVLPSATYVPEPSCEESLLTKLPPFIGPTDITLATKLKLAWALLTWRYRNKPDVVFGVASSGRGLPAAGIEQMLGPTMATAPLRIQIKREMKVHETLYEVQQASLEQFSYEHLGLQNIRKQGNGAQAACKFQTLLIIQPERSTPKTSWFQSQDTLSDPRQFSSYALTLACQPVSDGIKVSAVFDPYVIDSGQVQRAFHQFCHILNQLFIASEETKIKDLDMLSEIDRIALQTRTQELPPPAEPICVSEGIQGMCLNQPDELAVEAWDGQLTYRQLDYYATQLSQGLVRYGIQPNSFVALYFHKSRWTVVAQLAVLKAGGAFAMLDPSHPPQRLRAICEAIKPVCILTSDDREMKVGSDALVVTVGGILSARQLCQDHTQIKVTTATTDTMYGIATSGTTGTPKVVVIEHGAFMASARSMIERLGLGHTSRVIQFTGYSFDTMIVDHIVTLLAGGCICIPSPSDRDNRLAEVMTELRVNWAMLTTSVIQMLSPASVPTLRTLVQAGEPMTQRIVDCWAPHLRLINAYGPAECSILCCISDSISTASTANNIGFSSACTCWITDPDDINKLVPIGAEGELVIEGPILGRGYLHNPDRMADAFVKLPEWLHDLRGGNQAGRRVYRTGDIVKYAPDNTILYLGRRDNQVKLRGQRIELAEVEYHVEQSFPDAIQVVVEVVTSSQTQAENLTAFILSSQTRRSFDNQKLDEIVSQVPPDFMDNVRNAESNLQEFLPPYMVPSVFLPVSRIPWNVNGKVDRSLLRRLASPLSRDEFDQFNSPQMCPPETGLEKRLHAIWARVLNLSPDRFGTEDSFFRIGGDSINSMQVASQCISDSIAVTVKDIFHHRTIASLAAYIKEFAPAIQTNLTPPKENEETTAPLSPIQQMFFEYAQRGHNHFNQSFFLRISEYLASEAIAEAVTVVVETHSMLNSRFEQLSDGEWTQRISDIQQSYRYRSHVVNARQEMETLCAASQRSLDIRRGPLLIVDHFTVSGTQEQYLFLVAHHLIVDLVSWRIILADLEDLLRSGKSPSLPPISFMRWCSLQADHFTHNYANNISFCKEATSHNANGAQLDYWGDFLPNNYGDTDVHSITIDEYSSNLLLGDANNAFRTQPVELVQASIMHAFVRVFNDRSAPAIFTEGHGRQTWDHSIDLTRTVGWFTNIWPIHMSLDSTNSITEVVKRTKDARRQAQEESSAYLASCYSSTDAAEETKSRGPMEILFNYLGHYQQLERPDALFTIDESLPIAAANIAHDMPRFALLDVSAVVQKGRLELQFFINRNLKYQEKLRQWVSQCERSLRDAASTLSGSISGYTLSDFPLVPLTPDALNRFTANVVTKCAGDIQDIYPCSPIQQGMLISHARNDNLYEETFKWKVAPTSGDMTVSIPQLVRAWQQVVDRHDALRTSFVSISDEGYLDQLVMTNVKPNISVNNLVEKLSSTTTNPGLSDEIRPPHRLDITQSADSGIVIALHISHALVDGTSVQILKRDFTRAYDGRLAASSAPSYRDYIAHLQKDTSHQAAHTYWSDYLHGATPCLFPSITDSNTPRVSGEHQVDFESIFLDLMPASSLDRFCEQYMLSLTSVIHVAWAIAINRFTAMDNICFGYLTMGRHVSLPGIQNIVGPLINMLIGRVHIQPNSSLLSILQRCHEDILASLEHQHYSLAGMLHSIDLPATDVFNTVISIQRQGLDHGISPQASIVLESLGGTDRSEYPILLNIGIMNGRVSLTFTYQSSFVSFEGAHSIASTFRRVLTEVMRNPTHLTIHDIEVLEETDKRHLLDQRRNLPELTCDLAPLAIHNMCLKQPRLPAVVACDGQFTYQELDQLSSALAEKLINHGARPEQPVPLYFNKSRWTAIAMLATWKAGAPFVLLDPSHPSVRHRMICEEVNASLILSSKCLSPEASNLIPEVIQVGGSLFDRPCRKPQMPLVNGNASNMAYVVFTSGSTGKPKGVVIEHGSLAIAAATLSPLLQIDSASRVLQFAAYAWDVSILETIFPLLVGGCVCIPSDEDRMERLASASDDLEVNWAMLTPTVSRTLKANNFRHLNTLVLVGEPILPRDILDWHESVHLIQSYGVTECTIFNTVSSLLTPTSNVRNVGQPCGSVAWIVDRDDHSKLLPYGAIGELVLEGPTVGRGYLNQPNLSNTTYVDPPAWLLALRKGVATRVYKTGDLARYAVDGSLVIIGRKDSQVKLRGQRIELGEVEHHIQTAFPSALQVVVEIVSRSEHDNTHELAAFINRETPGEPLDSLLYPASEEFRKTTAAVLSTLQESTPIYMIPTSFFPLAHVPTAATGKVDRAKLRRYISSLPWSVREAYSVAGAVRHVPNTPMEARLQHHVAQVLQTTPSKIPLDHNLLQVGLDSIQVIRLVGVARNDGLDLSVRTFFQHPRLVDLAPLVTETEQQQDPLCHLPYAPLVDPYAICSLWNLDRNNVAQVLPTTYPQREFLEGKQPDYIAVHFSGHIDQSRLRAATESVVMKNAILRSIFVPHEGSIIQVVLSNLTTPYQEIVTDQDPRSISRSICHEDSQTSTAFGHMYLKFISIASASRITVILRLHHAQYDGFCLPYLFEAIASAYEGLTPRLAPDFPEYLTQRLSHGHSLPELQFWRDLLRGSSMTYLGATSPDSPERPTSSQTIHSRCEVRLPPLSQGGDVTLATVTKAAWALCLAQESHSHDLVFGQVVSGRTLPLTGIEGIIGPCVNIIPVRVVLQPQWKARDLLSFIQEQNTLTMTHDTMDLNTVISQSTDWPADTRFGSVVQYQNVPAAAEYPFIRDVGHEIENFQFNPPQGYPHLSCQPGSDGVTNMQLLIPSEVMNQESADRVLETFRDLVVQLLTQPDRLLSEFS